MIPARVVSLLHSRAWIIEPIIASSLVKLACKCYLAAASGIILGAIEEKRDESGFYCPVGTASNEMAGRFDPSTAVPNDSDRKRFFVINRVNDRPKPVRVELKTKRGEVRPESGIHPRDSIPIIDRLFINWSSSRAIPSRDRTTVRGVKRGGFSLIEAVIERATLGFSRNCCIWEREGEREGERVRSLILMGHGHRRVASIKTNLPAWKRSLILIDDHSFFVGRQEPVYNWKLLPFFRVERDIRGMGGVKEVWIYLNVLLWISYYGLGSIGELLFALYAIRIWFLIRRVLFVSARVSRFESD